jgi:hydroxymethylbilane synthase
MTLRIATRASAQALAQTTWVADELRRLHPGLEVTLVETQTRGDVDKNTPIWELGGKGIFAKEVQLAVLRGDADLAVHSGKDLPSATPEGLAIVAVPARRDARDVLIGSTLADLPTGARVATGSIRRRSQLAWLRPDLTFAGLRGNIGTRLERAADHDAIVMAAAALGWLGLEDRATEVLEPEVMLPQVAQGTLAIEARADDEATAQLVAPLEDPVSRRCFDAERAFLRTLGGDCNLPAGAHAVPTLGPADEAGFVTVTGLLASLDGHVVLRASVTGCDPAEAGEQVATQLLERGGRALLEG